MTAAPRKSTQNKRSGDSKRSEGKLLSAGDRMLQEQFHFAYEAMPDKYKAELINGVVCEPSPVSFPHGQSHGSVVLLFQTYALRTKGTASTSEATVILSERDEVQPDATILIRQEFGGQSQLTSGDYIKGAPELAAEVAYSSRAIDLGVKKRRYAKAGVLEYIVVCLRPKKIYWFNLPDGSELRAAADGIIRSAVFPGLWIHERALLDLDGEKLLDVLSDGLKSPEHRKFVAMLANQNK